MYVKDPNTRFINNLDDKELSHVKALRERAKREKALVKDMNSLQSELQDIREKLNKILSKEEYATSS